MTNSIDLRRGMTMATTQLSAAERDREQIFAMTGRGQQQTQRKKQEIAISRIIYEYKKTIVIPPSSTVKIIKLFSFIFNPCRRDTIDPRFNPRRSGNDFTSAERNLAATLLSNAPKEPEEMLQVLERLFAPIRAARILQAIQNLADDKNYANGEALLVDGEYLDLADDPISSIG